MSSTPSAAAVLYVHPDGSDAAPGSADAPLKSIERAASQAAPGDTVVVAPGLYREAVVLSAAGLPGSPIVFAGQPGAVIESPRPGTSLSAFTLAATAAHIRVEGFELRGGFGETVRLRPGAHHIELVGLDIHGNRNGIWIEGASDVVVRTCAVHDNTRAAVRVFNRAARVEIADTVSRDNSDGAGCAGDADGFSVDGTVSDIRFERVTAAGNSEDGFDIKAPNATVLQAISRDNGCSGMKLWDTAYVENALVERHRIGVNAVGANGGQTTLQSLTLVDNAIGVRAFGTAHTLVLRDSIVTGPGKALSYADTTVLIESHNVFHRPEPGPLIERVGGAGERNYTAADIASGRWTRETGQGADTVAADPRLTAAGEPVPERDSPAVDSASPELAPPYDLAGVKRPAGRGVDRGAYELPQANGELKIEWARVEPREPGAGRLRLVARFIPDEPLRLDQVIGAGLGVTIRSGNITLLQANTEGTLSRLSAGRASVTVKGPSGTIRLVIRRTWDGLRLIVTGRAMDIKAVGSGNLIVALRFGSTLATASTTLSQAPNAYRDS